MKNKRIGILTIGQSPRPDLVDPMHHALAGHTFIERGALDMIAPETLPHPDDTDYPLVTKLRDGTDVTVGEAYLAPFMQQAADQLIAEGASVILLACAGPFEDLRGSVPIIKPFALCASVAREIGARRIAILCPTAEQCQVSRNKWLKEGFDVSVWSSPDSSQSNLLDWIEGKVSELHAIDYLALDYFGHPPEFVSSLKQRLSMPVLDLGGLSIAVLAASVNEH